MTRIDTTFKADVLDSSTGTDAAYYADLKTRLEDALRELEEVKANYGSTLNDETYAHLLQMEAMLKAEVAGVDGLPALSGGSTGGTTDPWSSPTGLPAGFSVPEGSTLDTTQNADDAAICDDPSSYQGTINYELSGSTDSLNFSLQDDSITEVELISKGRDLVLVVHRGDTTESWVIKDGTVRSEPILIDATLMGHSVTIDASRSLRVSDGNHGQPYGLVTGFQIWGSNFDDTIYGSQGVDGIVGLRGNDVIDGGAGNDVIFGDDKYDITPATEIDGVALDSTNSRDDIRGGAGNDQIYGGAGIDTSYESDATDITRPKDMGGTVQDDMAQAPDPDDWFSNPDGNWEVEEDDDGTIVIRHTGTEGGRMDIDMDSMEGYTMAMADVDPDDPNSLIITFVGQDADGNPQTFNVRIEGFFESSEGVPPEEAVITLNIFGSEEGDIIDFHKIMGDAYALKSQNINIYGMGGNDIILGAEARLMKDGVDVTNWDESTVGDRGLTRAVEQDVFAYDDDDGYEPSVEDGMIVIRDAATEDPDVVNRTVNLIAPDGYDHGYVTVGEDGCTYVVLVKNDGSGDTVVFKFEDTNLEASDIFFWDQKLDRDDSSSTATEIQLIPIMFENDVDVNEDGNPDWNMLSGGEGEDVVFGNENSNFDDPDGEDFIVEGDFEEEGSES